MVNALIQHLQLLFVGGIRLSTSASCFPESVTGGRPSAFLQAIEVTPFHIASLIIFALAVIHTLFANKFTALSVKVAQRHKKRKKKEDLAFDPSFGENGTNDKSFTAEILHFLGEVEVIFGIWVIPLLIAIVAFYNWETAVDYLDNRIYIEPIFVVVIMCLAATKPILQLAENCLSFVAKIFGGGLSAWWFTILTVGPLLGSFITEAGAMTLAALLLSQKFYEYQPSNKFAYATIGLLFVNVSIGGVLTNFAAPPVLIIASCWDWSSWYMFVNFGLKAISGLLLANICYFFIFRREFKRLEKTKRHIESENKLQRVPKKTPIPIWITLVHLVLVVWVVMNEHYPAVFIGSFLIFLGFQQATAPHQHPLNLRRPILVGLFLAGLVIHGGIQAWWITPLLGELKAGALMTVGAVLTAFNDNAMVTYLASLIPTLQETTKQAVVSGVIVGGGLTVIANAPNPAGQMILRKYFNGGVSPLYLFLGALIPTLIFFAIFFFAL